jgi:hypothetical protein
MFDEIVQVDDDGRLFLSGAIEDWKPVHARRITIVIDLEGDVDHGVPTTADEFLYIYLPIHDGGMPNLERLLLVVDRVERWPGWETDTGGLGEAC